MEREFVFFRLRARDDPFQTRCEILTPIQIEQEEGLTIKVTNFDPKAALIDPMDYKILGFLPEEGATFNDAYPIGGTSKQVENEVFGGAIPATTIGPRMNVLRYHGLIIQFKGMGTKGAHQYQRTAAGKELFEKWQASKGTS